MNSFSAVDNVLKEVCKRFNCSRTALEEYIAGSTDEQLDELHKAYLANDSDLGFQLINHQKK